MDNVGLERDTVKSGEGGSVFWYWVGGGVFFSFFSSLGGVWYRFEHGMDMEGNMDKVPDDAAGTAGTAGATADATAAPGCTSQIIAACAACRSYALPF